MTALAEKWYPSKKLAHALRVAASAYKIASETSYIEEPIAAWVVGLAHDLLEDTEVPWGEVEAIVSAEEFAAIIILSKDDKQSYDEYIQNIINNKDVCPLGFVVKKADIKDHLSQTKTLTDKLKEKYFPHIASFL